jgi:hypothetical protein
MIPLLLALIITDVSHEFTSTFMPQGISLSEVKTRRVYQASLSLTLKGEAGEGTLSLSPNPPSYDDFGNMGYTNDLPLIKFACQVKFIKKNSFTWQSGRPGSSETFTESWLCYQFTGKELTSRLSLVIEEKPSYPRARLLRHDDKGKVRDMISMHTPPPPEPCHPGCFPAGTAITTPTGTVPVEKIRVGDVLTTLSGKQQTTSRVSFVFITRNRLYEVHTEAGMLLTTETQPLALTSGELRSAGELREGDCIDRFVNGHHVATKVSRVEKTPRHETVYNVVLGDPTLFIANGYLARSKPPAVDGSDK